MNEYAHAPVTNCVVAGGFRSDSRPAEGERARMLVATPSGNGVAVGIVGIINDRLRVAGVGSVASWEEVSHIGSVSVPPAYKLVWHPVGYPDSDRMLAWAAYVGGKLFVPVTGSRITVERKQGAAWNEAQRCRVPVAVYLVNTARVKSAVEIDTTEAEQTLTAAVGCMAAGGIVCAVLAAGLAAHHLSEKQQGY